MEKKPAKTDSRPWAAYARLSIAREESASITGQKKILNTWAKANGRKLVWFVDDGVSGSKNVKRPARDDMEKRLKAGEFAGIVAKATDRLARNMNDLVRLISLAEDSHASVVIVESGIDTSTPTGRLLIGILGSLAEFEAANIKERQIVSQAVRRQDGRALGVALFGYQHVVKPGGSFVEINKEEAKTVRLLAKRIVGGDSSNGAARYANDKGMLTRAGRLWTGDTVLQVLRNPRLNGQTLERGDVLRDERGNPLRRPELQILDNMQWKELQDTLDSRAVVRAVGQRDREQLLKGIAVCGSCGGFLSAMTIHAGNGRSYEAYRCSRASKIGRCPAPVIITEKKLHDHVDEWMTKVYGNRVGFRVPVAGDTRAIDNEIAAVNTDLAKAVKEIGEADAGEVAKIAGRITELKNRLETLTEERKTIPKGQLGEEFIPGVEWFTCTPERKRQLARWFIQSITVMKAEGTRTPASERVIIEMPS